MEIKREELEESYRSKETDELCDLYRSGTLTEVAIASCKSVLVERGVDEEARQEMEREASEANTAAPEPQFVGIGGWLIGPAIGFILAARGASPTPRKEGQPPILASH